MKSELISKVGNVTVGCADAVDLLAELGDSPQMIFMDPPFNIGQKYADWDDRRDGVEFTALLKTWIDAGFAALAPTGTLWLCLPDSLAATADRHAVGELCATRISWCIWHYRFAQCHYASFLSSKYHLLWYKAQPDAFVYMDHVLVESDRSTTYADDRALNNPRGGRPPFDVWGIPSDGPNWGRVQGNNTEKCSTPNQLPEKLLERCILASTKPGDLVVDPFGGSGTTAVVAAALGRRAVTGDICREYCYQIVERLHRGAARVDNVPN